MLRLREYETIYVMRPDISDVDADRITDRMRTVIRAHDGKIVEVNNWGKRKLAYEIAKHQKGIYVYWRYVGNNSAVDELERNLRLLEPVLRFLTVKLADAVNGDAVTDLADDQIPMRTDEARAEARSVVKEAADESASDDHESDTGADESASDDDESASDDDESASDDEKSDSGEVESASDDDSDDED